MALSRDTRMDRRRRVLWDASTSAQLEETTSQRHRAEDARIESTRKSAGYSQDVRQACGTRLVQLIPVRKRSFIALVVVSLAVTATLLAAHYLVYVNGRLPWYGHPLAVALDLSHPHSLGSWLASQLWMLCLGVTILTFQLRRHKLDDYNGEYRLWFWLVVTCVIASIDSTTHITELFARSLDRWARIEVGWSGKSIVLATLSTLIGMLGLRLCNELKSVPFSLICWLSGLLAWAASAALSHEMLRVNIYPQSRYWLGSGLWLCGITLIWIASVAYLRHVYIEAQRRFLARGLLARRSTQFSLADRFRQNIPFFQSGDRAAKTADADQIQEPSRAWSLRRLFRLQEKAPDQSQANGPAATKRKAKSRGDADAADEGSPPNHLATNTALSSASSSQVNSPKPTTATPNLQTNNSSLRESTLEGTAVEKKEPKRWSKFWPFQGWLNDEAPEYCKLRQEQAALERQQRDEQRRLERQAAQDAKIAAKQAKIQQIAADKERRQAAQATASSGSEGERSGLGKKFLGSSKKILGSSKKLLAPAVAVGSLFKRVKLPSLSAFQLTPPDNEANNTTSTGSAPSLRPADSRGGLPSTSQPSTRGPSTQPQLARHAETDYAEDADDDRQLSRAERKKMKRQNRAA